MTDVARYDFKWEVTLRHESQGFGKTVTVEGEQITDALDAANMALLDKGYDPIGFSAIAVTRKGIVRIHPRIASKDAAPVEP